MASTSHKTSDDGVEKMDQMVNGNVTDQDDGRETYAVSLQAARSEENDKGEVKDKIEAEDTAVEMMYGVRISCNDEQDEGEGKCIDI